MAWLIFTRYHIGPSVEGVLSICSNCSAWLNKMAAMPIFGVEHLKIFISWTKKASNLNLVTEHWGLKFVQMMTWGWHLTFLQHGQMYVSIAFVWGKCWKFSFSKCIKTNGWNLQCMIKVANTFSNNKNFVPVVICPCPWAIYMYKRS